MNQDELKVSADMLKLCRKLDKAEISLHGLYEGGAEAVCTCKCGNRSHLTVPGAGYRDGVGIAEYAAKSYQACSLFGGKVCPHD